jgi:hypothetical protein
LRIKSNDLYQTGDVKWRASTELLAGWVKRRHVENDHPAGIGQTDMHSNPGSCPRANSLSN